jgi:hypothetical protein
LETDQRRLGETAAAGYRQFRAVFQQLELLTVKRAMH